MEDTLSPHIIDMIAQELSPEEKIRINMANESILMDGSIYTLTVNGRDLASNDSETIIVSNILYDITPPSFSSIKPDSGSALNHQRITYSVSEDLFKGEVIWIQTGGTDDPDAPHKVQFEGSELKFGDHNDITLLNMPQLADGGRYTIYFTGRDRAGNIADTVVVRDILYDFTSPKILVSYPTPNLITNSTDVSYSLSETLFRGDFSWKRIGGVEDTLAPYSADLIPKEMKKGSLSRIQLTSIPKFVAQVLGLRPRCIGSIGYCCTGVEYLRLRITVIQLRGSAVNQRRT